jgi:N-acetylmuramoyl-L-alanine amidase
MALVVLDRGHVGKPGGDELGAWADLDLDGKPDVVEQEAIMTAKYILAAEIRLRELGHQVVCMGDGRYADRHARVNGYKADVYVQCHVNAGMGDYGLAIHDSRSSGGKRLAGLIAAELRELPELSRAVVGDTVAFPRAAACIQGVYSGKAVGICYEPFFIDRPGHHPLTSPEGLASVGWALAEGIHKYMVT